MKKITKKILSYFGYVFITIKDVARYGIQKGEISDMYQHFLRVFITRQSSNDFFFVQIGAHDGKTGDPIHSLIMQYALKGIVIEPQTELFTELTKNYAHNERVTCVHAAISDTSGTRVLYTADVPGGSLNASFDKNIISKTIVPKIPYGKPADWIKETSVRTFSFDDFLHEYQIDHINLLQIDCEGYDGKIIKMIDFGVLMPDLINYESKHLNNEDRLSCEQLLKSNGYYVFTHGSDTCAYKV